MKLKWLGHAAFLIMAANGTRILCDPYKPNPGRLDYGEIDEAAEVVTVSHEHGDHANTAAVKGSPQVVRGVGNHRAKGIEFRGIGSFHDAKGGGERGANTIFCFAVDGMRLCHLGDLGHPLSEEQVREIGPVDILMLPTGGPTPTLELSEAEALVQRLKPRVVIPMHFRNKKCAFPKYGVEDFVKGKKSVLRAGVSEVRLSPSLLPPPTQILALEPAL